MKRGDHLGWNKKRKEIKRKERKKERKGEIRFGKKIDVGGF